MKKQFTFILAITVAILIAWPASAAFTYNVVDLDTLGGVESFAFSINNNNQIVGNARTTAGDKYATLFDSPNMNLEDNDGAGIVRSYAYSINNNGQIVGQQYISSTTYRAILYDSSNPANNTDLGGLGGNSFAYSINDSGEIVGASDNASGYRRAIRFGIIGDLGTLGGNASEATSINASNQIVGFAETGSGYRATLYDPDGNGASDPINNTDLGALTGYAESLAWSINDDGKIVGNAYSSPINRRAVLFDITGAGNNIDLDTLGGNSSAASSINNIGQIVGNADTAGGVRHATLFDDTGNGNNIDLNDLIDPNLGWELTHAVSINDNGWIVGYGFNQGGETHAFLLKPIPEPATLLLLGLGGLVLRKRRR